MTEANQFTLLDVIQFLEHVQEITTDDIATIHKEIVSPNGIHDNEKSQVHLKMLLAEALNEVASLQIVIAKLKWEKKFDEQDDDDLEDEADAMPAKLSVADEVEIETMLAAIRQRVAERNTSQSQN